MCYAWNVVKENPYEDKYVVKNLDMLYNRSCRHDVYPETSYFKRILVSDLKSAKVISVDYDTDRLKTVTSKPEALYQQSVDNKAWNQTRTQTFEVEETLKQQSRLEFTAGVQA